jgi:hypothetical protein
MERILQTHRFGPHRVDVVEHLDDDGTENVEVVVDGVVVTDPPLSGVPDFEGIVRIYAGWRASAPTG